MILCCALDIQDKTEDGLVLVEEFKRPWDVAKILLLSGQAASDQEATNPARLQTS